MDEALALPSEKAVEIALRTQQIIAFESGVANVIDPLGGSYYIEKLTNDLEEEAERYFRKIDELGGVVKAIEQGFFQREITRAAYEYQMALSRKKKIHRRRQRLRQRRRRRWRSPSSRSTSPWSETRSAYLGETKAERDNGAVRARLDGLEGGGRRTENLMPPLLECARVYATLGRDQRGPDGGLRGIPGTAVLLRIQDERTTMAERKIKVIIAKPGLDGHDRGAKVVARALVEAGMEVVYLGLQQTPESIVRAAVEEDADVIGLSILSGAHMTNFRRVRELMDADRLGDRLLTGGGIIPTKDQDKLRELGVGRLFGPGDDLQDIVDYIRRMALATYLG